MGQGDYDLRHQVDHPDDKERCQALAGKNQCIQRQVPGSKYCPVHGGNKALKSEALASLNRYRLGKYQARVEHFTSDAQIKDLRAELGILRMILEEKLNLCLEIPELVIQASPIGELILKIQKLVETIHKLDKDLENLLDKPQILVLAERIIAIMNDEITDEALRLRLSQKIGEAINGDSKNQG